MNKKIVSGIMLLLFLISIFEVAFNGLLVQAVSSFHMPEKESEIVRVVEYDITAADLEKLKKEVGVREQHANYNQIINGYGTGLRPPTENEWTRITEQACMVEGVEWSNPAISAPCFVDHANGSWFPPIGNQDGEGSCTTWAVGYYMKTFQEAKEHSWDLSAATWEGGYKGHPTPAYQDKIFSPDFIYHQINDGEDYGSYFSDAVNLVCSIGACTWERMPYDPDDSTSWPSEEAWREAPLYRGNSTGIEFMELETDVDIDGLKNWIASDHLAAIAVDAYQYEHLTSDDVWTLDNYIDPSVNHANTIVGYDDDLEYMEEGVTHYGAFKIANSWGIGGWENIDDGCYWISYEAMKQRAGYCMFYRDRIGYDPKLLASFRIDHPKRGECNITFGIGNKSVPIQTKRFDDWILNGGNHPFCSNNIVLDITEFEDAVPTVYNQLLFIRVYDEGSITAGTIDSYSIEYYYNYSTGNLRAKSTYRNVPVSTINYDYVFAELILDTTWTVDDDGPADFHTIQEAIDVAGDGDKIFVYSGAYYENIVANKTVAIVGESKYSTIVDGNYSGSVLKIVQDNVAISNFTLRNSGSDWGMPEYAWDSGVLVYEAHNSNISNNIIYNVFFGVSLRRSGHGTICRNKIFNCTWGIALANSAIEPVKYSSVVSYNNITGTIPDSAYGILACGAWNNSIVQNLVSDYGSGISLALSSKNILCENCVVRNRWGIEIFDSSNDNNITRNIIANNTEGVRLGMKEYDPSTGNTISENIISNNNFGIRLETSGNSIYHNNIVNNAYQVYTYDSYTDIWDNGYPSGGNYWSDYTGVDLYRGPYQNETGSDGIGDTPYIIDENNQDRHPLMKLYPWGPHDIGMTNIATSKTVVGQGFDLSINVTIFNYGNNTETFNVFVFYDETVIILPDGENHTTTTLTSGNSTTVTILWNTTGVAKGNYTITAKATQLPGETDTIDNYTNGWVIVAMVGDITGPEGVPDGLVDIDDVVYVSVCFGSYPGQPNWSANADITDDGLVDIDDIIFPAIHFGETDP